MAYCSFENKDCPVKWAVLGLREGMFPQDSSKEVVDPLIIKQTTLGRLCDLVDGLIGDGVCHDGPEVEYATETTIFVGCQSSSAEAIRAVTEDAFNLLINTVESPSPETTS